MEIRSGHKESAASFISTQCPARCASQTEKALSLLQLKGKTKQNVSKELPSLQSRTNVTGCCGITLKSQRFGDGGRNIKGSRVPELRSLRTAYAARCSAQTNIKQGWIQNRFLVTEALFTTYQRRNPAIYLLRAQMVQQDVVYIGHGMLFRLEKAGYQSCHASINLEGITGD